jgi:hypothetical protein
MEVDTRADPTHDHDPGHTPTAHRTLVHTHEQGYLRIHDRTDHASGHQVHSSTSTVDLADTPRTKAATPTIHDRTDHASGHQVHSPTSTDDLADTPRTKAATPTTITGLGIELLAQAGTAVTRQKGGAMTTLPNRGHNNSPEKTKHTTFQN